MEGFLKIATVSVPRFKGSRVSWYSRVSKVPGGSRAERGCRDNWAENHLRMSKLDYKDRIMTYT